MTQPDNPPIPGFTIYDPVDPFENLAGPFYWQQDAAGVQHFALRVTEQHCNSHGIVHGGLLMTMIDLTLVITAKGAPDEKLVTVSLNSEFMASASVGDLIRAEGELMRRTRSMAFVRGQVVCGDRTLMAASAVLKAIGSR